MNLKKLLSLCFSAFLCACGGGDNPDERAQQEVPVEQNISGHSYEVLSEPTLLKVNNGILLGKGVLRFAEDLGSVSSDYNYGLAFLLEPQGKLHLYSHVDKNLENGLELVFSREGTKLRVEAIADQVRDDWSSFFKDVDASKIVSLSADFHNSETLTHILLGVYPSETPLLDSAVDVPGAPGSGYGQHWGLKLDNARVFRVNKGPPLYGH